MAQYTFKTDDGLYDVIKLNDTAKTAFNYLAQIQTEVQGLTQRIGKSLKKPTFLVLIAAAAMHSVSTMMGVHVVLAAMSTQGTMRNQRKIQCQ